jgi:putative chitinase
MITAKRLSQIMPRANSELFAPLLSKMFERREINTPDRITAFLAQAAHESTQMTRLVEGMNYGAEGLVKTWPTRFNPTIAARYARKPEAIANFVYGGREGNGDEASGDGWKYRGRGIFQITFANNYRACGDDLKLDLMEHPELLEDPELAVESAGWFWDARNLNELADVGDFLRLTKKINVKAFGYAERVSFLEAGRVAFA